MPDWCRDRATDKLFYRDRALLVAEARVIEVVFDVVILDRTVFYPEGGGQQGDRGWLTSHAGPLRVRDTQKRGGMLVARTDLPVVMVDTEVLHFVEGDASRLLRSGDEVEMNVDGASRAAGSRRHSAVHLLSGMFQRIGADSDPSFALTGFHITADDAWIDVEYLGASGNPQGSFVSSAKSVRPPSCLSW